MKKIESGFSIVLILLIIVILGAIGATGWLVFKNEEKKYQSDTSQQTNEINTENTADKSKNTVQTMNLVSASIASVTHDSSWTRLTEYGYERDGLFKTIDGVDFLITFTRTPLEYDYMDRTKGGAYPAGMLYKEIIANGKPHYIGTNDDVPSAFLSTCKPSANGACSLLLPGKYGYMIVDMQRFAPTQADYKARSPLVLGNAADQKAIDEFATIMSTIKF